MRSIAMRSRFVVLRFAAAFLAGCVLLVSNLPAEETAKAAPAKFQKALFLGNSITLHGPAPKIGWTSNWGMAASALQKDYVHLTTAGLAAGGAAPTTMIRNIADFERGFAGYDLDAKLKAVFEFKPDLVFLCIGENVPALKDDAMKTQFGDAVTKLLEKLKAGSQPRIVVRSSFWASPTKDAILKKACDAVGGTFVDISKLGKNEANFARSEREFQHAGVAAHPGDRGMQAIAEALLKSVGYSLPAALAPHGKTVKVLAVGNSFSQNALHYFSQIAAAAGNTAIAQNCMIGGCDFERHMRHADAFEANPNDPNGRPYPGQKSLKDLLTQEKWDYVTIQQASPKSFRPETYHPHVDRLIATIKKYAPQAEIVIHETWAYRDDHGFFGQKDLNADAMYAGLHAAYLGLQRDTGFRMIPCGDAMEAARHDPAWGKFEPDASFDPKTAVYPALPKNEKHVLHNGYGWHKNATTGKYYLAKDCIHANAAGEYLLGCVWLEFFFHDSSLGNTFAPKGVSVEDAAVLQKIAHRVMSEKQGK
jgi:lysophospholipase L1-like esterase